MSGAPTLNACSSTRSACSSGILPTPGHLDRASRVTNQKLSLPVMLLPTGIQKHVRPSDTPVGASARSAVTCPSGGGAPCLTRNAAKAP